MQKEYLDSLLAKFNDDSQLMTLEELLCLRSAFYSLDGRLYLEEKFISVIDSSSDEPYYYDFDTLFLKIEKRIRKQSRRSTPLQRMVRIAAAVLLPVLVAGSIWLYFGGNRSYGTETNTIARIEDKVRLTTPDGSEIILDQSTDNVRISTPGDVVLVRKDGNLIVERQIDNATAGHDAGYGNLYVPRGTRFDMVLEDGTHVWLNSDSRLRFPSVFADGERRVYLEGEAYFEVTHNSKRPFIVETARQELKVLGTSFNVSAYQNNAATYTTLVEGSVALKSRDSKSELILRPGQQARLNTGATGFTTVDVDAGQLALWKNGVFVFESQTLEQVMRQLARWYNMDYSFADNEVKDMKLRGMMPVQTEISSIFDILETSGRVKFLTENNKVIIRAAR